jgi:hypothetical protein
MNGSTDSTAPSTSNVLASTNNDTNRRTREAIFVLCDNCHWSVTFIDKSRLNFIENGCIVCEESLVSSFPILDNESFTIDISERRGVELKFGIRRKQNYT